MLCDSGTRTIRGRYSYFDRCIFGTCALCGSGTRALRGRHCGVDPRHSM
jgi:hypothetical protein